MDTSILVFRQPNARRKATQVAAREALKLMASLGARQVTAGPFGDPRGLFYLEMPSAEVGAAVERMPLLGYTASVERVNIVDHAQGKKRGELARWRGKPYTLEVLYEVDAQELRQRAPDRREFLLPAPRGGVRKVVGYRGDGGELGKRGLPVLDARLLVNLAVAESPRRFLDPFAGAGGVIVEALQHGYAASSTDIDPTVMHGLRFLGARHAVADARALPFPEAAFDSIASEPPYDASATQVVCDALPEIDRVLSPAASVALLVAEIQSEAIAKDALRLGWIEELNEHIDRKGLPVTILNWRKP